MKLLVLAAIAAALIAAIGMSCYTDPCNQPKQNDAQKILPSVISPTGISHTSQNAADAKCSPCWKKLVTWPEGITALAIILILFAIVWQAVETGNTAEAALLSAQAVINAERPWMTITIEPHPTLEGSYFYKITNKGRTPATIVEAYREIEYVAPTPDSLPIPPHYSSPMYVPPDNLRVTGEAWDDHPQFKPEGMDMQNVRRSGDHSQVGGMGSLCFYGQITYTDAFPDRNGKPTSHYTRWCYVYDVFQKRFSPSGPREYREKT